MKGVRLRVVMPVALALMTLAACTSTSSPPPTSSTSTTGSSTTTTTTQARPITTTSSPSQDVGAVHFLNANVGWATEGIPVRLLMTTDGGARWREVSPPNLLGKRLSFASVLSGQSFLSPTDFWVTAYGLGRDVFLFHTTDAGRKWVHAGTFPNDDGTWVSFLNDRLGMGRGGQRRSRRVRVGDHLRDDQRWTTLVDGLAQPLAHRDARNAGKPRHSRCNRPQHLRLVTLTRSLALGGDHPDFLSGLLHRRR